MTQEQEFEFRARAEAEAAAAQKPTASAAPRASYNPATDLRDIYARRVHEGAGRVAEGLKQGGWGGFGKALMGGIDYASSPISAAQEFVVGRPIETATGGVIPANVAGDVAGMVMPFAPLAASKAAQGGRALSSALKYGTQAKPAVEAVRAKALAELLAQKEIEKQAVRGAGAKAARYENIASKNQALAQTTPTIPTAFGQGKVTTLGERGVAVQEPIVKAKEGILQARGTERAALEQPVIAKVAEKESAGESIADTPEAKALLKDVRGKLNPSPTKSPTITSLPTKEESRVYSYVDDALSKRRVPITAEQAATGKEAGQDIIQVNGTDPVTGEVSPTFYRVFKTQYDAVDNLRRRFGDAFHGKDVTGFEGVSNNLIKDMYGRIKNIQGEYVGKDLFDPLQESYAKWTKQLAPFNETKTGSAISGTEGQTGILNLTPSEVPGAVLKRGSGGLEQAKNLGANESKLLADTLETVLHDPVTNAPISSEQAIKLTYNTPLGDALSKNKGLQEAFNKHITQLRDAEMAGVKAQEFKVAGEKAAKKAAKFTETSKKAKENVESLQRQITSFEKLPFKEVLPKAESIINKYAPISEQGRLLDELRNAEKLYGEKGVRDWIKRSLAAGALGLIGFKGTGALLNKTSAE